MRACCLVLAAALGLFGCGEGTATDPEPTEPLSVISLLDGVRFGTVGRVLGEPVRFAVIDADRRPVPGVRVLVRAFTGWPGALSTSSSGVPEPLIAESDERGVVEISWTLGGLAGQQTLAAFVTDAPDSAFVVGWARASFPVELYIVGGNEQTGLAGRPLDEPLEVHLRDSYANDTPGVVVSWVVTSGGGSVTSTPADSSGVASAVWVLGPVVGEQTLEATDNVRTVTFSATALAVMP